MPVSYRFKRVEPWDGSYVWRLIERDLGVAVLGFTEYPEETIVHFDAELTTAQKAKLDSIMDKPPTPVRYEMGLLTPEEVLAEVGVKPVRIDIDPQTGLGTVDFEKELTPGEMGKLKACLAKLKRFRKR